MPHLALYRKYRPKEFGEVLGQSHVVSALSGAIKNSAISHAYLFSGTRGTGKTSIARIFARAIGCSDVDLYEIDAASNRGIDDVRELRESVKTLPFESKYKVYIIDEAHMLTKEAFNALLKTLEEPPVHAVFILATTEAHKLPETVVSRCQHFNFKKPSREMVKKLMAETAKKEGYDLPPPAAEIIATLGDGSFRDSFGVLEKVVSSIATKKITPEDVERITGAPETRLIHDFLSAVTSRDISKAFGVLRRVEEKGSSMRLFLSLVLDRLRSVMLLSYAPDMQEILKSEYTDEDFSFLEELSKNPDSRTLLPNILTELLNAERQTARSSIPALPIELAVVRVCGEKNHE